jgi:hypothetical protein
MHCGEPDPNPKSKREITIQELERFADIQTTLTAIRKVA